MSYHRYRIFRRFALPASAQDQEAQLAEAKRLDEQVVQLYQAGRYAEAATLVQRILAIQEKALGPEHPDVATSLDYLSDIGHGFSNLVLGCRYAGCPRGDPG
jgi:hypothetical protein